MDENIWIFADNIIIIFVFRNIGVKDIYSRVSFNI